MVSVKWVCVWSARRDLIDGRGRRLRGIFSARSLPRVFAIGLAGRIIGADSSNNLLPRVVQCVAKWGISSVGCRHARVQLIFFVAFFCHARGERFLIQAAVPVCALKANGTILFFLRRYHSARRLLICRLLIWRLLICRLLIRSTAAKHNRTCHYHKE